MKINCDVIGDLLPLYAEEIASPGSVTLVEAHMRECRDCSRRLASMRQPVRIPKEELPKEMKDIGRRLLQRTILLVMAMIFFTVTVVTWTFSILTFRHVPVPLESSLLGVRQENGTVYVEMRVTGSLSWWDEWDYRYDAEVGEKIVCLSVNRRLWDTLFREEQPAKIYEVPVRDATSIWFFTGGEAECIYGDESYAPKTGASSPVFWISLGFGALCLVLFLVTKWKWLCYAALLAGNLLLADLACVGIFWLYDWHRDLGFILVFYLFLSILMTCSQCLGWALWKNRHQI